jgi:transposase-like protein
LIHLTKIELEALDPVLASLVEGHGEDGCRLYLEQLRWPLGVECPRCSSDDVLWLERRRRHNCRECRYQFRVTARTVFHDSHLSLPKWFLAVSLMLSAERGLSAFRLQRILGGSYKSAWFLEHRIRSAMAVGSPEPGGLVAFLPTVPAHGPSMSEPPTAGHDVGAPPNWPLLRGLIAGVHRNIGPRYLAAYWDEVRWRHEKGGNAGAFRDTVRALLDHPWLPYEELTGSNRPAGSAA